MINYTRKKCFTCLEKKMQKEIVFYWSYCYRRSLNILSNSSRRTLSNSWRVLGVVGSQKLVCRKCPKHAALGWCSGGTSWSFIRVIPNLKKNNSLSVYDMALIWNYLQLQQWRYLKRFESSKNIEKILSTWL